jgi:hypothetical protein
LELLPSNLVALVTLAFRLNFGRIVVAAWSLPEVPKSLSPTTELCIEA